jgi:hypothetical protein
MNRRALIFLCILQALFLSGMAVEICLLRVRLGERPAYLERLTRSLDEWQRLHTEACRQRAEAFAGWEEAVEVADQAVEIVERQRAELDARDTMRALGLPEVWL